MMAFTSRQHHSTIMTMVGYTVFETVWLSLAVGQRLGCIGPGRGSKEIQILRVLIAYKNTSSCLGSYKMTFVRLHPCPELATLPDTRNLTKMSILKRFCFLFNFLI